MGRSEGAYIKKADWTKEEDQRLIDYIKKHGDGCWPSLPKAAGLRRSGESCRLRWFNHLQPALKGGNFTDRDHKLIVKLHSSLGGQWSLIAAQLGRTDIEIKNYWNTHIKPKHNSHGIGPHTNRPLNASTATDHFSVVNSNKNDNNRKVQELEREQNISCTQVASLNAECVRQQNSDASNNSISSSPPIGYGGSASVHAASNRATRDLNAVKKEDAGAANSISESFNCSRWEKGERIGAGGYGTVYVACNRETRASCAVKEIKDIHEPENIESIIEEVKILSQLEHTHIVKYYGHETVGSNIFLYMEYVQPGSLKKYILNKGVLPEHLIRNFTGQILSGLVYLHSKRVVHRDIKPDNLLVDSNNIVKLVDFGLAKHLAESVGKHSKLATLYYTAPELLDNDIEYQSAREAYAADIWSLGCAIIEMFSGNHPWPGFEPVQVVCNVLVKMQSPPIPEGLCREGKDFVERCFKRTPADRPSAAELLDHPFVRSHLAELHGGGVEVIGVLGFGTENV